MDAYAFTVFTPTHDRAHTLPRVYESLAAQTFLDFEWVVVDDGSTDNTAELVSGWQRTARFPINYIYQHNSGKHIACNRAVREAKGALFLTLDSDDACVPEALERFLWHWRSIPEQQRPEFSAVTCLCKDESGALVGDRFPSSPFDSNSLDNYYRYKIRGEKWGFQTTAAMKEFPFPAEIAGFVTENVVWWQIARKYKTRYVNDILRIYYCLDERHSSISSSISKKGQLRSRVAGALFINEFGLNNNGDYFWYAPASFAKAVINYGRFGLHCNKGFWSLLVAIRQLGFKLLFATLYPLSILLYQRDQYRS
jgi:glycosyltransferase involved in cell wall biosynthesis